MSSKARTEDLERGLLSDSWVYARETERSSDVRIAVELTPTEQRGVWSMIWTARAEHQNGGWVVVCSYSTSYPTARHSTLAGALLRGSMEIDRIVDEWLLGVNKHLERPAAKAG
jgi:hypothetical protein